MIISCFRGASRRTSDAFDTDAIPRRVPLHKRSTLKRVNNNAPSISSSRSSSNASIAQLPPCPHLADPKVEAMMMPVPPDSRPSHCLRLSYPKIYSNIISDMKEVKGCRDWRNFAVFDSEDVDMNVSAVEYANRKAKDCEKKMAAFASFSEGD